MRLLASVHHSIRAFFGYLLLGALFFLPLLPHLTTRILADDIFIKPGQSDAYNNLWTYWWIQKATFIGESIFHCSWVLPPTGADLFFHSTSILPTFLSVPFARLFGVVAGYNLMVFSMLVLAAWIYYLFLTRALHLSRTAAFIAGAMFGFCPYFLFKAHAHINLIGAFFWGGALAVLVHVYVNRRFTVIASILFAVFVWGTFWSSFVEFFMLAVMLCMVFLFFEIRLLFGERVGIGKRLLFYLPLVFCALPAVLLLLQGSENEIAIGLLKEQLRFSDLFAFPKLSLFADYGATRMPEYWGNYLPIAALIPAVIGVFALFRKQRERAIAIFVFSLVTLCITINLFGFPATLLRALPLGAGFRVMGRFLPFLLFFLLIFTAFGIEFLMRHMNAYARVVVLGLLLLLAMVEYAPYRMQPSAIMQFPLNKTTRAQLDREKYLLVLPHEGYRNIHDTYQVTLDIPCVRLSYLAREDQSERKYRAEQYPVLYADHPTNSVKELKRELAELQVRYLLFDDQADVAAYPIHGKTIAEQSGQILVDINEALEPGAEMSPEHEPGS